MQQYRKKQVTWLILALILLAGFAIVLTSPAEQTIGNAIKFVYVHVAFTRAGMLGFYLTGAVGLLVAFSGSWKWQSWASKVGWVALGLFTIGFLISILAQRSTWGGIAWNEPRNHMTFNILALSIIVLILGDWLPWVRLRGFLYATLGGYVAWNVRATPLVLHPADPIGTSSSAAIQWTFLLLTWLCVALGAWIVWYWHSHRRPVKMPAH